MVRLSRIFTDLVVESAQIHDTAISFDVPPSRIACLGYRQYVYFKITGSHYSHDQTIVDTIPWCAQRRIRFIY